MGNRRKARETALQALYLTDTCGVTREEALKTAMAEPLSDPLNEFTSHLVDGVLTRKNDIDAILGRYVDNWDLRRLATVDRNILRLSTFEILTDKETPISVIINEAIEIAKLYSMEDSGKFVNGILDKVKAERK